MSEIDELKALVARMATDAANREEAAVRKAEDMAARMAEQTVKMQEENAKLIAALAAVSAAGGAPGVVAAPNAIALGSGTSKKY